MSTGTRRQDHDRADAYDHVRTMIRLELARYARRLKAAAEAIIDERYQEAAVTGQPFDYLSVAQDALEHAQSVYFAAPLPPAEETEADAPPAA